MGLSSFFSINMPYGISRNSKGEWFAFNREYLPIGWNSIRHIKSIRIENVYSEIPIYTKYSGLSDSKLRKLAHDSKAIKFDDKGKILRVFLYDGRTHPINSSANWAAYIEKLKILGALKRRTK